MCFQVSEPPELDPPPLEEHWSVFVTCAYPMDNIWFRLIGENFSVSSHCILNFSSKVFSYCKLASYIFCYLFIIELLSMDPNLYC